MDIATEKLLDEVIEVVPRVIRNSGPGEKGMCILATRVVIETLRRFQLRVEPVSVRLTVANAAWEELVAAGRSQEAKTGLNGAWALGTGPAPVHERNRWDGHLVALVEGTCVLDAALHEWARPEKGIELRDLHGHFDPPWSQGDVISFVNNAGVRVRYQRAPERLGWKETPNWQRRDYYRPLADVAERSLRRK